MQCYWSETGEIIISIIACREKLLSLKLKPILLRFEGKPNQKSGRSFYVKIS